MKPRIVSSALPRGAETILLVEDEDRVREFVYQLFTSVGYTVLPASDGYKALEMCEQHAGPIHILLTDILMPRLNGWELAGLVKTLYPDTKVIYMSGCTEERIVHDALQETNTFFLQKPCTPLELTQKVREVLDASEKPLETHTRR